MRIHKILFVLILGIFLIYTGNELVNSAVSSSKILFIKGDVQISKSGGAWKTANSGESLSKGNLIKTADSSAVVLQIEGATLKLSSNAFIVVQSVSATQPKVKVQSGTVLANVRKLGQKSRFSISSPTATAGVRGTLFYVTVTEEKAVFCVKKGVIDVKSDVTDDKVSVKEGLGTEVVGKESPSKPEPVKKLIDSINWNMDIDTPVWKEDTSDLDDED